MAGKRAPLGAILLLLNASPVWAAGRLIADPGTYLVDAAGAVDGATAQAMERLLAELQQKTGAQVKVLLVRSTEGEDFFGFVQRHAEAWRLGTAGKDNGALIALSIGDRQVRIQTGYGLEHIIPDSWCGTVSRQAKDDYFKAGQYGRGLLYMAGEVAKQIAQSSNVTLTTLPTAMSQPVEGRPRGRVTHVNVPGTVCGLSPCGIVFVVFLLLWMSSRRRSRWRGGMGMGEALLWGSLMRNMLGGSGRSHWGGGHSSGFGGGSFGGGSFGGGGRFGGGGGGASW